MSSDRVSVCYNGDQCKEESDVAVSVGCCACVEHAGIGEEPGVAVSVGCCTCVGHAGIEDFA